jgi:hypothetical protein
MIMISRTILSAAIVLAVLCAQPKSDPPKPGIATATKEARPSALAKDAAEVEPGLWKHTDREGNTWMYRRTPFGVSRYPAASAQEGTAADEREAALLKAEDAGDSVKFERKTPFGLAKWTRKKSELDGPETMAWKKASGRKAASNPAAAASQPSAKTGTSSPTK